MIRLKTVAQQTILFLAIGLLAPLHGSPPASGGSGAEQALEPAVAAAVSTPGLNALVHSKNIVNRLTARSLGVATLRLDRKYLQDKIAKTSHELAIAQAENNDELASELESQIERLIAALTNAHHAPFRRAYEAAKTKLNTLAPAGAQLTAARALLGAIPADDLLNRMALCFAWRRYFPLATSLDATINLRAICTAPGGVINLNFNSINALDNHETIAQLIVDFLLAVTHPTKLLIKNSSGSLSLVSSQIEALWADGNPLLTALDLSICPHLRILCAFQNPMLTDLRLENSTELGAGFRIIMQDMVAENIARIAAETAAAEPAAVAMPAGDESDDE